MDDILKSSLLFDFYGELLTDHQKEIYTDFLLNDLSLGEIASQRGISRQGVYDIVKRCEHILEGYEQKLHLVERFMETKKDVESIYGILEKCGDDENIRAIRNIAQNILDNY